MAGVTLYMILFRSLEMVGKKIKYSDAEAIGNVISLEPCQVPGHQLIPSAVKDFTSRGQVLFRELGMRCHLDES